MRKKLIIPVVILLCAAMLAACGTTNTAVPAVTEQPGSEPTPTATAANSSQTGIWQAQFIALESEELRSALQSGCARGEALYYISSGVIADETPEGVSPEWPEQYWVYGPILVKATPDGKTEILPYTPERPESLPGENCGVLFEQLYADPDGSLWVLENRYRIENESGLTQEEKTLVQLQEDGSVLKQIPLQSLSAFEAEEVAGAESYAFTVPGLACDAEGNLCIAVHEWLVGSRGYAQQNRICILDKESGALKNAIELDGEIAALVRLGSGALAEAAYSGSSPVFSLLDAEKAELSEVYTADDFLTDVVGGTGDSLYYGAGDSFYCLNMATGESEKLFDWAACDVAHSDGDSVCALENGSLVTTAAAEKTDGVHNELILLNQVDASAVPEKKTLRLAVLNLYPFTSEMISRFNRSQTEYRIEVTDYSQFNDYNSSNPEDWDAGLTRLQTELIAGNVPDLIDISLLPVSRLGEKGLLEDLLPYIDADPELSREQLNMHVLEAFEEQGKLFQTVSNYYVMTTMGLRDVVGDRPGWTMEDFSAAMQRLQAEHPDSTVFDVYTTRDSALTFLMYLEMENYVNWNTGECFFDSESFRQLLQFVRSFPTAYDWSGDSSAMELDSDLRMLMGEQLMKQCNLTCFEDVQANTVGLGGAPCTFVGYPTEHGVGSMFAQIGNAFAISSSCGEKEAAWAFVRQFFLPAYQEQLSGSVFPTNLAVYEQMKHDALTTAYQRNPDGSFALDDDGRRIEADRGSVTAAGMRMKLRASTEEEIALVEEVVAATSHVLSTDNSLKDLIVECAAPYFVDQRSVEDVVRQIQSRASIYVNEQR